MYRNLRVFRIESRQDVRQYERTPKRRQPQGDLAGGAVSYTHLDVYKRQVIGPEIAAFRRYMS